MYAYSHLCFGTASFLSMYHAYSLRRQTYLDPVTESCLPSKYTIGIDGTDFLDSPCTNGMIFSFANNSFVIENNLVQPVSLR